jgi:hypothetical protein
MGHIPLTVLCIWMEQFMSRRKYAGFNRSVIKAAGENWEDVRRSNSVLRRLERRRATRIEVKGYLAASKIAWKAAVLQQALTYRTIELAAGCAKMWNLGNVLCSILAARALLETISVTLDFEAKLQDHCKAKNFEEMDNLITTHTFATRDESLLAENPELEAKNVLTYIDRLEKTVPGIRKHYLSLSEWCHPNSYGHYFTFGSLNRDTGTVSFSKLKLHGKDLLNHILAVYLMVGLTESAVSRLDDLILKISNDHPAAFPVNQK